MDTAARAQHPAQGDPHRPQYHFMPPANWMNDPNGMIQWHGQFHLFYQYNPAGPFHGTIHWGHASSPDLVRWRHLPIALAPTPGTADQDGCWSGVAVDHDGVATIIYSGERGRQQRACLATSVDPELEHWEKYGGNPIIEQPPHDLEILEYRDHSVWREDDGWWYQLMGAGIRDVGGAVLLYRSRDLRDWEYVYPLLTGDDLADSLLPTGSMWECPSFFPLGGKHVLVVSIWDSHQLLYPVYIVGSYRDHRFLPERWARLDLGDQHFYAPQTMRDAAGRTIMFGWVREGRPQEAQHAAGWSGVMSLPRVLTLGPDDSVRIAPVAELETLRGEHRRIVDCPLAPMARIELPDLAADHVEIIAEIDLGDAQRLDLHVLGADSAAHTRFSYDRAAGRVIAEQPPEAAPPLLQHEVPWGALELDADEPLRIHLFVDRSVVEVFVNQRITLTNRTYTGPAGRLELALVAHGGRARVIAIDAWAIDDIWPAS